jgi:hypothetical protein
MSILTDHPADKSGNINVKIYRFEIEAYAV